MCVCAAYDQLQSPSQNMRGNKLLEDDNLDIGGEHSLLMHSQSWQNKMRKEVYPKNQQIYCPTLVLNDSSARYTRPVFLLAWC